MPGQESRSPAHAARIPPPRILGPYWRARLETRWQARLREITELSLAYHGAAGAAAAAVPARAGV
jgi:hypothetical protein